jgi:hypothetical protein
VRIVRLLGTEPTRFVRRAQVEQTKEDTKMPNPAAGKVVVLIGHIFLDANGTGDPNGQKSLEGVGVVAQDQAGTELYREKTGADGKFQISVPEKTPQVSLVLKPAPGALPPADNVIVTPAFCAGGKVIEIPYRAFGQLFIDASAVGQDGNKQPFVGPMFSIYKGPFKGDTPIKQITATGDTATLELQEGQYTVALTGFSSPDLQERFELVEPPNGVSGACVTAGQPVTVEFDFEEKPAQAEATPSDIHKIQGNVTGLGGAPLAGVAIRFEDKTGTIVGQVTTDKDGHYECLVDAPGDYFVVPLGSRDRPMKRIATSVHSTTTLNISFPMKRVVTRVIRRVPGKDPTAYPLLTEEVGWAPSPLAAPSSTPGGGTPAGAPVGQAAAKAVSDVLGWKLKTDDPNGFVGALTQSFQLSEVEGHVESTWKPRTYAVQTDLGGGISGAQASLYLRAKDALDQSLPLLDGLYPLDPEADQEDVKALRELARSQMTELVQELGAVGGPSISKVNTYFTILLGTATAPPSDADSLPDGTLKSLRDVYGIYFKNNPFSNSIEDEQDITNFRVISDYMTSLLQTWINNKQFFTGAVGQPAFLGTQLVLISRQLSVVAETVNEVRFVLDSVFIGPSERQTLAVTLGDGSVMFLEDILRQIEGFVTDEAPRLLRDGGRLAVTSNVIPVVDMLESFIGSAQLQTTGVPDGYQTVRVQNSLDDLLDQLDELLNLAQAVGRTLPPPEVTPLAPLTVVSVNPNSANGATGVLNVMILGMGFLNKATCSFRQPAATADLVQSTQMISNNLLLVQLRISYTTAGGAYDVTVTNPDGTNFTLQNGFTV